jgi:hypothetical protein
MIIYARSNRTEDKEDPLNKADKKIVRNQIGLRITVGRIIIAYLNNQTIICAGNYRIRDSDQRLQEGNQTGLRIGVMEIAGR